MLRPWTGIVMGVLAAFFLLVNTELATVSTSHATGASGMPVSLNPDVYYFRTGQRLRPCRLQEHKDRHYPVTASREGLRAHPHSAPSNSSTSRARL